MSCVELINVVSIDKLRLPGLLYSPAKATKKAAIWLHGMGDSGVFYNPPWLNTLGDAITATNIAFLAFNNRGAHNSKSITILDESLPEDQQKYQGGTYFERIADCVQDINGAVSFLKERGFSTLYLLGHSTGANKVCAYHNRTKDNPFAKYVLAGPADDSGLYYAELGEKKFWQVLQYAKRMMAEGKPLHIMPKYTGMYPFSAQAAADIMDPEGDYNTFPFYETTTQRIGHKPLFKEYSGIDRPTLVVLGDQDEYTTTAGGPESALNILKKYLSPKVRADSVFELIKEADHSFRGAEPIFAETVASWLAR
jgi:alpha-beta hydrolase superfamily lysophospholipase